MTPYLIRSPLALGIASHLLRGPDSISTLHDFVEFRRRSCCTRSLRFIFSDCRTTVLLVPNQEQKSKLLNTAAFDTSQPMPMTSAKPIVSSDLRLVSLLLFSGRLQRAVFFRRRCSLAFISSFMSAPGRISKVLPYFSAGCCAMSCNA